MQFTFPKHNFKDLDISISWCLFICILYLKSQFEKRLNKCINKEEGTESVEQQ